MDTSESRIGRIERELAALAQKVVDLATSVGLLSPVPTSIVEVRALCQQTDRDVSRLMEAMEKSEAASLERHNALRADLEQMRREGEVADAEARKQVKTAVLAVVVAIIGAMGTVWAAGLPT